MTTADTAAEQADDNAQYGPDDFAEGDELYYFADLDGITWPVPVEVVAVRERGLSIEGDRGLATGFQYQDIVTEPERGKLAVPDDAR